MTEPDHRAHRPSRRSRGRRSAPPGPAPLIVTVGLAIAGFVLAVLLTDAATHLPGGSPTVVGLLAAMAAAGTGLGVKSVRHRPLAAGWCTAVGAILVSATLLQLT